MIGLFKRETVRDQPAHVWAYVSPSRLNAWLRCPLAFKLKYIEGIREPTTATLFLGKAVHASLECYYRHRQLGVPITGDECAQFP